MAKRCIVSTSIKYEQWYICLKGIKFSFNNRNGKFVGTFFSTASIGGGQETTALSCVPFFVHMGLNFVPLGYKNPKLFDLSVPHGGSPWGAGTIAGPDGSRHKW